MFSKFLRSTLFAALGMASALPASAQEPEQFHPLWENAAAWEGGQSPIFPVIGTGNPTPNVFPDVLPDNPTSGTSARSVPEAVSDEIAKLAAALGNDPVRIFNHVRNTIDYDQYFGLRKGPELTLLEGSGNDLDTCSLLAELLRAAGHTQYQFCGQVRETPLTGNDGKNLFEWFGLAEPFPGKTYAESYNRNSPYPVPDLEAKRLQHALNFIYTRRVPVLAPTESHTSIAFTRFWLKFTYEGVTYDLDPSFKRYQKITGIDLKSATGYQVTGQDRAALMAAAAGTVGNGYVAGLNDTNIASFLAARTGNLLEKLVSLYPGATVAEIVKGRKIIEENITDLAQAFPLPNLSSSVYGTISTWANTSSLANGSRSVVTFNTGGLSYAMPTADLKGRKISLAASGNEVQLWLDDVKVAWTTVVDPAYLFTMTVYNPGHPVATETKSYKKSDEYVYALVYAFNASGRLIQKRYEELDKYLLADAAGSGRAARSEILNIMGLTWLYQTELVSKMISAQNDISHLYHHRFGRMAQEQGFYVDVGLQYSSDWTLDGVVDDRWNNCFHLSAVFGSAMEQGIIEQMQPGTSAISTVGVIRNANKNSVGDKQIYLINKALVTSGAGWTTAQAALAAYNNVSTKNGRYDQHLEAFTDSNGNGLWDAGESYVDATNLQQFKYMADNGGSVMVPKNMALTAAGWQWSGSGWILRSSAHVGMIINGGYSGGWNTNWGWVAPAPVTVYGGYNPSYTYSPPSYSASYYAPPSFSAPSFFGADPVDMATGAFTLASDDMATGLEGAPRGLAFSRYYTSNSRDQDNQRMGYGWTHSLNIRAVERTASEEALGLSSPRQAAAFLTAMTIASDLYRDGASAKEWATAVLAAGWYVDELTNNAVAVEIGHQQTQFIQRPDGSYEPPAGSTLTLKKVGTNPNHTYSLTQRNSNTFNFEKAAGVADGSQQRIKQIVDQDGRTMSFKYLTAAPDNRLDYVEDAVARRYTFRYDANNRIDRVTDSSVTRFIGFAYDASGNLTTYTDPEGKNSYYDYSIPAGQSPADPSGTVIGDHRIVRLRTHDNNVAAGQGIITQNVYDSMGRVSEQYLHGDVTKTYKLRYTGFANTEENPVGGITTYYYDDRGRATGTRDPEGNTQSWKYDGQDHVVEKTTGSGETTVYHYDGNHNVTQIDHPRGGGSEKMYYDSLGRLDLVTDADDNSTDLVYNTGNTKDRPDEIIDPVGKTTYTYITSGAAIGRVWKITDNNNTTDAADDLVTEYAYQTAAGTFGHPIWKKEPGSFQTFTNYSPRGDLLDITDPNDVKTAHLYNARRQVTQTTIDQGGATQAIHDFTYDNQGNPSGSTAPPDNDNQRFKTRQEFSPTNKVRFTRTTGNDGVEANDPFTEIVYDRRDWQKESFDAARRLTSFTSHPNGNLDTTTAPLSRASSKTYDGDSRPLTTTAPGAPANRTGSVAYTTEGGYPKNVITTPDNLTESVITDRSGNTRFHHNRKAKVWEFRYDGLGRRTHVITPLDALANRAHVTEYLHGGAVKRVTDPSGQATDFAYAPVTGRLSSVTDGVGTISHTLYDNAGNLKNTSEVRTGVAGTKTTERTYDRQNRLLTRKDENNQTIGYRYYPSGKLWKIIYPGGSETGVGHVEYTWWPSGKLKDVIDKLDSTGADKRTTHYDWFTDGHLQKVTRDNGTVREIAYDAAGRPDVIQEYGPSKKLIFVHKQSYYPSDEMKWRYELPAKRTSGLPPPPMKAMTYNDDNQLETWDGLNVIHDQDGNMTTGPSPSGNTLTGYSYDARNRLTGALGNTYIYDADGQRTGLTNTTETTTFTVDVSSNLSKVLVRTKNGVPTRYVWGLGLLYEVTGSGTTAKTTTYHYDSTGSTLALTDDDAKVIERIDYTPFGQISHRVNLTGTVVDTPFLFTGFFGNQTDANGLIFMRARYYHPRIGRFLNADPAQEGMNWYGYAGGNPIGFVDPMGLGIDSALDYVQNTLSFLGMVPVFGAVFDIINTGISIGRGDYAGAAINFVSALPGLGDFVGGAKIAAGGYKAASVISGGFVSAGYTSARGFTPAVKAYDVGTYSGLKSWSVTGDALDIHHAGQAHPMSQIIPSYDRLSAPAIAIPRAEHVQIPTIRGVYNGSARDLLANDIRNLRNFTNAPSAALQELIKLNKQLFPGAFTKP